MNSRLFAMLAASMTITAAIIPINANAAEDLLCQTNRMLRLCPLTATLSSEGNGDKLFIKTAVSIRITNTGKLPVSLFSFGGSEALFSFDKGGHIQGRTTPSGIFRCNDSNPPGCIRQPGFSPTQIDPNGTTIISISGADYIPFEAAKRMATAKTLSFSFAVGLIDGDQKSSTFSLSATGFQLDNGLTGIK